MDTQAYVFERYGDILSKEDLFLGTVESFISELAQYLQSGGVEHDAKFEILDAAYARAIDAGERLSTYLGKLALSVQSQVSATIESKVAPLGHPSRELSIYLEGCMACQEISPRKVFFEALEQGRKAHLVYIRDLLAQGAITGDQLWEETQSLALLETTIPVEMEDEKSKAAMHRKRAVLPIMAFAVGNLMKDQGIDFVSQMIGETQ